MDAMSLQVNLDDALRAIAVQGSYGASRALSKWLGRPVRVHTDGFLQLPLDAFGEVSGGADEILCAAHMVLEGDLQGDVLLSMPEQDGLALVDMLTRAAVGTTTQFGEIEQSCLKETGNIVGSAFTNALASWLELTAIPAAPTFVHDLGCAIIQPLLFQQALVMDTAWLNKVTFELDDQKLDWALTLFPNADALQVIQRHCTDGAPRRNALQAVAINACHYAAQTLPDLRLASEGFQVLRPDAITKLFEPDDTLQCNQRPLSGDLSGTLAICLPTEARGGEQLSNAIAAALQNATRAWLQRELVFDASRQEAVTGAGWHTALQECLPAAEEVYAAPLSVHDGDKWHSGAIYLIAERGNLTD